MQPSPLGRVQGIAAPLLVNHARSKRVVNGGNESIWGGKTLAPRFIKIGCGFGCDDLLENFAGGFLLLYAVPYRHEDIAIFGQRHFVP